MYMMGCPSISPLFVEMVRSWASGLRHQIYREGSYLTPRAFRGLKYRRSKVGHLGLAACPAKLLKGGWPTMQRAHASAAPDTKPDHDMHGGPAGYVHIFINIKVTVFRCVLLCT